MDWLAGIAEQGQGGLFGLFLKLWTIAHIAVALIVTKRLWPDSPPGGLSTVTLTALVVGIVDCEMIARLFGRRGKLFDLREGGWGLMWVCLGLAYALSLGLFAYEWRGDRAAAASDRQRRAAEDDYYRQLDAIRRQPVPPPFAPPARR